MTLLASYLEATQLKLEILFLVEELLQSIGQDDICVVKTAILLVELIVLVIFDIGWHRFILHHLGRSVGRGVDHPALIGGIRGVRRLLMIQIVSKH